MELGLLAIYAASVVGLLIMIFKELRYYNIITIFDVLLIAIFTFVPVVNTLALIINLCENLNHDGRWSSLLDKELWRRK